MLRAASELAVGPVGGGSMGWAVDHATYPPRVDGGALTVRGDARVYLVQDHAAGTTWGAHKYVRLDLRRELRFNLDLSQVPCGCLACVCSGPAAGPPSSDSHRHAQSSAR